jgi:hypothetical protein
MYDVFARQEYPEPLIYIGSVEVDNADAVAGVSLEKYGPESEWIEMVAVPQQKIVTVFSEYGEDNHE